ncbi:MAG: patatin-like phospholipase family protein [Oculatellaceae cyanobacterium Prado106]|nr:patatin-like phospholipase family protein [Oculatellaceae cyanobacterium Prado106]
MQHWNIEAVRQQHNLYLSDSQIRAIQAKLPKAEDQKIYADAVFEGGGVKGIAFLGALRCFNDAGIQLRKVAGTSAGALMASVIAAGFTIDQLEEIVGNLDYMNDILNQKTSPLIFNGSPADDLQEPVWMIGNLVLTGQQGQYSTEPFKQWLSSFLDQRLATFPPLSNQPATDLPWYQQRLLKIVVSDISEGEMRILPDDLPQYQQIPENFSVAEAVRLSMSIPLFFAPGQLNGRTIIDGGILSNFPLWIYDAPPGRTPKCPTFGFQLTTHRARPRRIKGAVDILSSMFDTMLVARDRYYQRTSDQGRVIGVDTAQVSATKFDLTNDDKAYLYRQGYESARTFLLEEWDWQTHLQKRGYLVAVS